MLRMARARTATLLAKTRQKSVIDRTRPAIAHGWTRPRRIA
jgi:hypothetical protein